MTKILSCALAAAALFLSSLVLAGCASAEPSAEVRTASAPARFDPEFVAVPIERGDTFVRYKILADLKPAPAPLPAAAAALKPLQPGVVYEWKGSSPLPTFPIVSIVEGAYSLGPTWSTETSLLFDVLSETPESYVLDVAAVQWVFASPMWVPSKVLSAPPATCHTELVTNPQTGQASVRCAGACTGSDVCIRVSSSGGSTTTALCACGPEGSTPSEPSTCHGKWVRSGDVGEFKCEGSCGGSATCRPATWTDPETGLQITWCACQ